MFLLFIISIFFIAGYLPSTNIVYSEGAYADDISSPIITARSDLDPKTLSVLKDMTQYIGTRQNYTFKAEIMYDDIQESGRKLQVTATEKVFVERPDKFYVEYNSDYSGYKLLYNHDTVTLLDTTTSLYTRVEAPDTVNSTLKHLLNTYEYAVPLSDFMYLYPFKTMIKDVVSSDYLGTSLVFGVRCHNLSFQEKDKDWQIWIETGARKLPRKLVINYKDRPGSPQFIAILQDWILNEPFSKTLFKQNLTKNARTSRQNLLYEKSKNNFGIIIDPD